MNTSPCRSLVLAVALLATSLLITLPAARAQVPVPTVQFSSPPADVTVVTGDNVPFALNVSDPGNVLRQVQIFLNGQILYQTGPLPAYVQNATAPAPGTYNIRAVVTDTQGRQSSTTRTVTVVAPGTAKPTSTLVTPVDGRQFAANSVVTLTTAASNADGSLPDHVDFYADGVLFASFDGTTGLPRSLSLGAALPERRASPNPAAGSLAGVFSASFKLPNLDKVVSLIAVAISKSGQGAISAAASVRSVATTTDRPPNVTLNSTRTRSLRLGSTFTLPVVISDPDSGGIPLTNAASAPHTRADLPPSVINGLIAKVEYFINQLKIQETNAPAPDQSAPPAGDVTFTPEARGIYVVNAVATDGAGLATVSDPVVVDVEPPPTVNLALAPGVDPTVAENGGKIKVLVTRDGDLSSDLTVFLQLRGTATPDVDYTSPGDRVVIPAGKGNAKLRLKGIDDTLKEGTETINVKIVTSPTGDYIRGTAAKLKISLLDND